MFDRTTLPLGNTHGEGCVEGDRPVLRTGMGCLRVLKSADAQHIWHERTGLDYLPSSAAGSNPACQFLQAHPVVSWIILILVQLPRFCALRAGWEDFADLVLCRDPSSSLRKAA